MPWVLRYNLYSQRSFLSLCLYLCRRKTVFI
jgi:hypothetical protein